MIGVAGGCPSPINRTPPSTPSHRSNSNVPSLPPQAPEILVKNTICLKNNHKVFSLHEVEQRRIFQGLVRRYIAQILYGCQERKCTTPTCLSYRRRVTDAPLRKFTALSARTVACFLASDVDPGKGLCPHKPVVAPELQAVTNDPKLSQNQNQNTRNVSRLKEQTYNVACQVRQPTPEAVPISGEQGKSGSQSGQTIDQRQSNGLHASGSEDAQPRQTTDRKRALAEGDKKGREKDPKSFTQNLFDTFAVRMLELLPVPSLLNDEQSKMEGKEDSSSLTGPDSETQSRPSNKLDHSQSEIKKPGNTYVSESKVKPRSHSVTARLRVKPASVSHQSSLSMPLKASKQRDLGQPDELKQESLHRDPSWRQQTPRQQAAHDAPQPRIPNNSTESDDTDLSETRNTRHNTAAEVSDSSRTWGQLKTWGAQTHGSRAPASRTDRPEMVRDRRHSSNLGVHQFENIISESGSPTTADLDLNATSVTVHPVGLGSANEPSNLPPTIQNGYGEDGANHVLDVAIKPGGSTSLTRPTSYRTSSLSQPTSSTLHQEKDLKMTPASLPVTGPPRLGRTKSAIPTEIDPSGGQLPQTLSHLSLDIIKALVDITTLSDEIAEDPILFMKLALSRGGKIPKRTAVRQHRRALQFAAQSLFYVMSTPEALIQSFRKPLQAGMDLTDGDPVIRSCHPYEIDQAIRLLKKIDRPKIIFRSLWIALGALFAPLPDISHPKSPKLKAAINTSKSRSPGPSDEVDPVSPHVSSTYYPDREAVHIVKLALSALVAAIPNSSVETMRAVHKLRASGKVAPDEHLLATHAHLVRPLLEVTDVLEDELALRLTSRLVQAVAARCCAAEITKNKQVRKRGNIRRENRPVDILELLRDYLREARQPLPGANGDNDHILNSGTSATDGVAANWSMSTITVEWLRSVLLKEWDGKAEFARWGVVGGAVMILASLYEQYEQLGLSPETFHTPFLAERLDPMETPVEWLGSPPSRKTLNLLSYSFLFPPSALVTYFRALNYSAMSKAYETSVTASRLVLHLAFAGDQNEGRLCKRLKTAMSTNLVLEVRRDNVLRDALNQLWRRERRELMRPLKVRMGMDEGEEGVDHGGVQQEFFRMAIGEALNPDYGLLTVDTGTRMTWFQPCSLEPVYKFELLGLLTSLAVYNGLTLPLTFPKALYRKLLGLPVTELDHIRDGWPDLSRGLSDLLTWTNGDVEDIFMRSYEFVIEAPGSTLSVDMEKIGRDDKWPLIETTRDEILSKCVPLTSSPPKKGSNERLVSDESNLTHTQADPRPHTAHNPPRFRTNSTVSESNLVTNANRAQYVKDYIFWLTDKSIRPQYDAFARGFFTCLDRQALSLFTPAALQSVIEGIQEIDIDALERTAKYDDGYTPNHRVVKDFWHVVKQYTPEKKKQLLEFVTASDRVPVNGIGSIQFVLQRNGTDDSRLPTSLTCFGRLLLPEYSCRRKLREKLRVAIENCRGFGVT